MVSSTVFQERDASATVKQTRLLFSEDKIKEHSDWRQDVLMAVAAPPRSVEQSVDRFQDCKVFGVIDTTANTQ